MQLGGDERGVSEVLGAILVFGLLVTSLGLYQSVIVPNANEDIEFKHNAEVRGDMQDLEVALMETSRTGNRNTVQIQTGVRYPARTWAIDSEGPAGVVSTSESYSDAIVLENVGASGEAGDYWNGNDRSFDTRFISYTPGYNYYQSAPTTTYEPTVVYSSAGSGDVIDSPQKLIDDGRINLVLVDGEFSRGTQDTISFDTVPISSSERTVDITASDDTNPITLTINTNLEQEQWQDWADDYSYVNLVSYSAGSPGTVTIDLLDSGGPYSLNVAKVGIDADDSTSAAYMVNTDSKSRTLNPGESAGLTVRVLDKYGNPVEGETVYCCGGSTKTTNENGLATFSVPATGGGTTDVEIWFGDSDPSAVGSEKKVTYSLSSSNPTTGTVNANLINPGSGLIFDSASIVGTGGGNARTIDVVFENTNSVAWENVTKLRVNYYFVGPPGSGSSITSRTTPSEYGTTRTNTRGDVGGSYVFTDGTFNVSAGNTKSVEFTFYPGSFDAEQSDFFFVSLVFEEGTSRIYVVSVQ